MNNIGLKMIMNIINFIFKDLYSDSIEKWKIKVKIDYKSSFRTNFEGVDYIIIYLTIFNKNEFELKKISFNSEPFYELIDNFYKPYNNKPGDIPIIGFHKLVSNSFGVKPIKVDKKDNETGALIFKISTSESKIEELVITYNTIVLKRKIDNDKLIYKKLE
ncbi:MAG: hypothetical protein RO257_03260 [Candidatus Kapabacteria bacterium]|nr:hypothetical protein [Candidatus Kapabacteria bacterium]